jgi:hypothetical protein
MMVFSPGIIGQVAWFILIDKRQRRAGICIASYKARLMAFSCCLASSAIPSAFYPFTRPLTIVHFARRTRGHRAGCWAIALARIFNLLILLSFIL